MACKTAIKNFLIGNWLLCLIVLLALMLRLWGISFGLPGIDHGDESEVVNHAVRFGGGDLNPHRFVYGTLVQYSLFLLYGMYFAIGYAAGMFPSVHDFALHFVQDPTVFYLIARSLSAVAGTATVVLVYLIGARIANKTTGLLSALFLAVANQHVVHSHYCTVDAALTFFFTLAVFRSIVLYEQRRWRDYLWAGLCVGLAGAVKYNGIFASLPLLLAHCFSSRESVFRSFLSPKLWAAAGCIVLGHMAVCPFFYFEISTVLREVTEMRALHAADASTLPSYFASIATSFWGIPLGAFCLLGMLAGPWRNRMLLLVAATAGSVLFFASLHRYVEAKYVLHAFPLLAVCGADLLVWLLGRKRPVLIGAAAGLLCLHSLYGVIAWDYEHARTSISLEAKLWIEEHLPVNSKLLLDNVGNAGPKLENSPQNYLRQYRKAARHGLMKAEYLKLKSELRPAVFFDIVKVDSSAGSIASDYAQYCLWEDLEEIGHPAQYYRMRGFDYIIITDRYFSRMGDGCIVLKQFSRKGKGIRIYRVPR